MKLNRNIKVLSWINYFTDLVFFAPVAIIYFTHETGSYALGMSIFSIVFASAAVFEVPTGIVSDLVGRKKTTLLGAACAVCGVVLYAIGGSYWLLASGALFEGLSRAFYSGNNDALLHDTLTETGRASDFHSYLGRLSSMFQFALATAAVVGSIMASQSFALVMWASVIPQVCALLLATQIVEPSVVSRESTNVLSHLKESLRHFRRNHKLRLLTGASVLRFSLGESAYFLNSAFINSLWPLWAVGVSHLLSHVGAAISFYFSGRIIDRFGPLRVLNFEIIIRRAIELFALAFPTVASPALMSSTSLTFGAGSVATGALLQKEYAQNQRATMSSLGSIAGSIAFSVFSVILGSIADSFDTRIALIVANLALLAPLLFYRMILTHDRTLSNVASTAE
jgi:MFS family permease